MTKKRIKFIAALLLMVILSAYLPSLISNAAAQPTIKIVDENGKSTSTVTVGSTVTVTVKLENGITGRNALNTVYKYDMEYLEIVEDYCLSGITGGDKNSPLCKGFYKDSENNPTDVYTATHTVEKNSLLTAGDLLEITFKVKKACPSGTNISISAAKYQTIIENDPTPDVEITNLSGYTIKTEEPKVPITNLTISDTTASIDLSTQTKTKQLTAIVTPDDTTDAKTVTWSSSDSQVATVSSTGLVTGLKAGTATITASVTSTDKTKGNNGVINKTCVVTVTDPITGIDISETSKTLDMNKDENVTLTVSKKPSTSPDALGNVEWFSSNEAVATVANGKVIPVAPGTTNVKAKVGTLETQDCVITVIAPINKVSLSNTSVDLQKNGTKTLTYTVSSSKVGNQYTGSVDNTSIVWKSSNEGVATVDQTGKVTALTNGTTDITVELKNSDGTKITSNVCKVSVTVPLEGIEITNAVLNNKSLELSKGQTDTLGVTFNPSDYIGDKSASAIQWTSSDESKVKVENGKLTALKPTGNTPVTITATSIANNQLSDSITVVVPTVSAETVTINKNTTSIEKGSNETLSAIVKDANGKTTGITDDTTIIWSSDNEAVAKVDENGKVTAVAPGSATITAKVASSSNSAQNGKISDTCIVTVTCKLNKLVLSETSKELDLSDNNKKEFNLIVTKDPVDATVDLNNVVWTSTSESIATVDQTGKVTAVAPGTTTIKATLNGKTAECSVKVVATLTGVEIENSTTPLELINNSQTSNLKVVYTPSNATVIPKATWTSSNDSVVKVDANGKVTAISAGTATITVDYGNNIKSTRNVKVIDIPATGVIIDQNIESVVLKGHTKLTATIEPANSTDKVLWESSDPSIVTIDENGNLKALKSGIVTIKAISKLDSNIYKEMTLEVKEAKLVGVTSSGEKKEIEEGSSIKTKIVYNPTDTSDEIVNTYEALTPAIATIDSNGKITGKKIGKAKFKVTTVATHEDGTSDTYESEFSVNVVEKKVEKVPENNGITYAQNGSDMVLNQVKALTNSPHTGDINVIALGIMMIVSLAGMIIIIKKK